MSTKLGLKLGNGYFGPNLYLSIFLCSMLIHLSMSQICSKMTMFLFLEYFGWGSGLFSEQIWLGIQNINREK